MKLARRLLALVLLLVSLTTLPLASARADDNDTPKSWAVERHATDVSFDTDGTAHATTTIDFDFSDDPGHGPFLVFVTRMRVPDDPDHWRQIDITVDEVTSPSGAPADLESDTENGQLSLRVGREDTTVSGVQTYLVKYRVRGLVAPRNAISGLDEVNWSVIGSGWQVPIRHATATVRLPAAAKKVSCFTGKGFTTPCQASQQGTTAQYSVDGLATERGMQVVAGLPAGTFAGAEPRITKRYHFTNMFGLTPLSGGLSALVAGLGSALVVLRARRKGRDQTYTGLTPGLSPTGDTTAGTTAGDQPEVAVAFTPPPNTRPGEIGTLMRKSSKERDVVATLVDLSVRGHLRVESTGEKDFTFHLPDPATDPAPRDQMDDYEAQIREHFLRGRTAVSTDDMADKDWSDAMPQSTDLLYKHVVGTRGWFTSSPATAVAVAGALGGLLLAAAAIASIPLAFVGLGLVGVSLAIPGIVLLVFSSKMAGRTAEGSAVLAQAKGFELYLKTAEADQLRWEEGEDIFSKYLPWAIAFDVADRWVKLFEQLAAQGRYDMAGASWYYGTSMQFGSLSHLDRSVTSSMERASAAASSDSRGGSGGSGFSGGGGFGGGGGGGW